MDKLAAVGLSLKQQKDIRSVCTTFQNSGSTPARQDLSIVWAAAERAIRSLGPHIEPQSFSQAHIQHLGPVLLGEMIWSEFSDRSFISWVQFKESVDLKYGLTRSELLDAFYEMSPGEGETEAAFVLRVEKLRVRY
jgi:predicted Zn-dependent protease